MILDEQNCLACQKHTNLYGGAYVYVLDTISHYAQQKTSRAHAYTTCTQFRALEIKL